MNPRRKKRLTIIAAIFIGLGCVVGLVLYALSQNIDLFYAPTEIHQGKKDSGIKAIEVDIKKEIAIGKADMSSIQSQEFKGKVKTKKDKLKALRRRRK